MLWVCVFMCAWICMCVSVWICMCAFVLMVLNAFVVLHVFIYVLGVLLFACLCFAFCVCVFTVYWGDAFVYDPKFFRAFLCVSVHTGCVSVLTSTVSCACICVFFYCLCRVCFLSLISIRHYTIFEHSISSTLYKSFERAGSYTFMFLQGVQEKLFFLQFTATPTVTPTFVYNQ